MTSLVLLFFSSWFFPMASLIRDRMAAKEPSTGRFWYISKLELAAHVFD
jgi:hypothetical protein